MRTIWEAPLTKRYKCSKSGRCPEVSTIRHQLPKCHCSPLPNGNRPQPYCLLESTPFHPSLQPAILLRSVPFPNCVPQHLKCLQMGRYKPKLMALLSSWCYKHTKRITPQINRCPHPASNNGQLNASWVPTSVASSFIVHSRPLPSKSGGHLIVVARSTERPKIVCCVS